jgi:hypothetical protein
MNYGVHESLELLGSLYKYSSAQPTLLTGISKPIDLSSSKTPKPSAHVGAELRLRLYDRGVAISW